MMVMKKTTAASLMVTGRMVGSMPLRLRGEYPGAMELALADPFRLYLAWRAAPQLDTPHRPENVRKHRIDAILFERGIFARMQAATQVAMSREFRAKLEEARAEREAARNEADVAALCYRILTELGADMTDLQVRLRRRTRAELRAEGKPRQATGIAMRITPTLEAARAAVAAADGQPSEGLAAEISETEAGDSSGDDEQTGQGDSSG
jgi:hypothetical protein